MSKLSELIRFQDSGNIGIGQYGGLQRVGQEKQATEEELKKMQEAQESMYKKEAVRSKAEAIIELTEKMYIQDSKYPPHEYFSSAEGFYNAAEKYMKGKLEELEKDEK